MIDEQPINSGTSSRASATTTADTANETRSAADRACDDAARDADTDRVALVAFYGEPDAAHRRLDLLLTSEAPMDRISVLGRADSSGDDPLGIYYPGMGERMRGWGGLGAFWGGILGLVGGASGLFLLPGVGAMVAAGPLVGALAGAAAGGVLMGGAGAGQQLAVAIHRMGIPESCIGDMQERLARGETLLMLVLDPNEAARWRPLLEDRQPAGAANRAADEAVPRPVALWQLPFTGVADAVREQL
jgi:hypothetical protein